MKHPVTQLMTAMMGSANSMTLHRSVIRALRDADCPNPLEAAAVLEHIIYLQADQGEWVVFPLEEVADAVFTPPRTFQRLTAWLKATHLLESKRGIRTYKGQSGNFTLYRADLSALSEMLGCGAFEHANLARSKPSEVARSTSISRNKRDVPRNEHFDAIVAALYPQGDKLSNASHVAKVANSLKAAGWTPEDITHVLSAVQRDKFWKTAITLGTFQKNAEDWRRRYGVARKEEVRPPVVTPETTPDDLDWTALE